MSQPSPAPQSPQPPSPPKRQLPRQPSPMGFMPVPQPSLQPVMRLSVLPRQSPPSPSDSQDIARNTNAIINRRSPVRSSLRVSIGPFSLLGSHITVRGQK